MCSFQNKTDFSGVFANGNIFFDIFIIFIHFYCTSTDIT